MWNSRSSCWSRSLIIAQQVAEVKGVPLEEVLRTVRDNTRAVYGI